MTNEEIRAQLTALTMLVEGLMVEDLAKEPDPIWMAGQIIDHRFQSEAENRATTGEEQQHIRVTEILTALIDRAAARAASLRASGHHD